MSTDTKLICPDELRLFSVDAVRSMLFQPEPEYLGRHRTPDDVNTRVIPDVVRAQCAVPAERPQPIEPSPTLWGALFRRGGR